MSTPSTPAWLTVSQAAQQIGISERALRRLLELPENAALTRQETRRTRTGTRQAVVINPEWVAAQATQHGATPAEHGAPASNAGTTPADSGGNAGSVDAATVAVGGATPAIDGATLAQPGDTSANDGSNAALTRRIDQLEGIVTGGFLQRLQSQLEAMPTRDDLANVPTREDIAASVTEAATAAIKPLLETMAAQEQRHAVEAAEREKQHAAEMAAFRQQLEELKESKAQRRGFLARWFGE